MGKRFSILSTLSLLYFLIYFQIYPEGRIKSESPEDAKVLFDFKSDDAEISLFWLGYWKLSISQGGGFLLTENGPIPSTPFGNMDDGFQFSQTPDLQLSLWVDEQIYFEMGFIQGYDRNTFLLGYKAKESDDHFIREIKLGNTRIGSEHYFGVEMPEPEFNAPGALIRMESEKSRHELLGRMETSGSGYSEYIGNEEVFTEFLALKDFIKGRSFYLPQQEIKNLAVYMKDPEGKSVDNGGNRWRQLGDGEYSWLPHVNELLLNEASTQQIAVFYTSGGYSVGSEEIRESELVLTGSAGTLDKVPFYWDADDYWDPDERTFSETRSSFIDGRQTLLIYKPGLWGPFENASEYLLSQTLPDSADGSDYIIDGLVSRNPSLPGRMTFDLEKKIVRFGYSSLSGRSPENRYPFYDLSPDTYINPLVSQQNSPYQIKIRTKEERSGFFLNNEIMPGSLKVFINSTETKQFEYSPDTGEITFSRMIFPADHIEFFYQTPGGNNTQTSILQGNRLILSPESELEISEIVNWDFNKSVSLPGEEKEGNLGITGSLLYDTDRLQSRFSHSEGFSIPNSTGVLELAGMDNNRTPLTIVPSLLSPVTGNISGYDDTKRVPLIYYDYSYNVKGDTYYYPYNTETVTSDPSREGPSASNNVKTEGDPETYSAHFAYNLNGGEWSAGDIYLSQSSLNLSSQTTLEFTVKRLSGGSRDLRYYLAWGELGENSDIQEDGIISLYDSSLSCRHDISAQINELPINEWRTVKILLDDTMRRKMGSVRQLRLIIADEGNNPEPEEGRLVITTPAGSGSSFSSIQGDLITTEINENDLYAQYSELPEKDDNQNKSLLLYWNQNGDSPQSQARRYFSPTRIDDYRRLVFYLKGSDTDSLFSLSLKQEEIDLISVSLTPLQSVWQKVTVNLDDGTAVCDSGVPVSVKKSDLHRPADTIEINLSGSKESTLLLDEIRLESPKMSWDTKTTVSLNYTYDDPFFAGGESFTVNMEGSQLFYPLSESPDELYSTNLFMESGVVFPWSAFSLSGDMFYSPGRLDLTPGYSWTLPAQNPWFYISHEYAASNGKGIWMNRAEKIHTGIPELLSINAEAKSSRNYTERNQNWKVEINQTTGSIFSFDSGAETGHKSEIDIPESSNWGTRWADDWNYLYPDFIRSRYRYVKLWSGFNLDAGLITLNPSFNFQTSIYPGHEYLIQNHWNENYRVSFNFMRKTPYKWAITPFYIRNLNQENRTGPFNTLSDDFKRPLGILGQQFPLSHYPFYTEIEEKSQWERLINGEQNLDKWNYHPSFGLELSRNQFGGWIDLFLFQTLSGTYSSHYAKSGTSYNELSSLELNSIQRSINLSGRQGTHPLFIWYESDEFQNSLTSGWEDTENAKLQFSYSGWQSYLQLWAIENDYFKLDNNLQADWIEFNLEETHSFIWHWEKPGEDYLYLSLFDRIIDLPWHSSHEEMAEFELGLPFDQWTKPENFSIVITHSSALHLKGAGILKAWLSMGLLHEKSLYTGAYEVGLELTIQL